MPMPFSEYEQKVVSRGVDVALAEVGAADDTVGRCLFLWDSKTGACELITNIVEQEDLEALLRSALEVIEDGPAYSIRTVDA